MKNKRGKSVHRQGHPVLPNYQEKKTLASTIYRSRKYKPTIKKGRSNTER
jgi:hypothetical protein